MLHTNDLFMEMAVAAPEDNVSIYQPQLIAVPPYSFYQEELWWAQTKGYSVNSINSLRYENFLKSYAAACESGMILDCRVGRATELWRLVTSQITNIKYNMFQTMTLDLERQREVNKMTSSVPEVSSWKVFIKRLLFYLLPRSAAEFITDSLSFVGSSIKSMINWLSQQAANMFLHAFWFVDPVSSAVLEEVIKTIPFGALIVSFFEMKHGDWSLLALVKSLAVHAPLELLSFQMKFLSLPVRVALHAAWNFFWSIKERDTVTHVFLEEHPPFHGVVKGGDIERVEEQNVVTSIDPVFEPFEPNHKVKKRNITNVVSSTTPMYAAQYTTHNIVQSIMWRNMQEYQVPLIPKWLLRIAQNAILKTIPEVDKEYTPLEWIHLENLS